LSHPTSYRYAGDADPSAPGGITAIYRDLMADGQRTRQVTAEVAAALTHSRNCLILTSWTAHLQKLADALREMGRYRRGQPTLTSPLSVRIAGVVSPMIRRPLRSGQATCSRSW